MITPTKIDPYTKKCLQTANLSEILSILERRRDIVNVQIWCLQDIQAIAKTNHIILTENEAKEVSKYIDLSNCTSQERVELVQWGTNKAIQNHDIPPDVIKVNVEQDHEL